MINLEREPLPTLAVVVASHGGAGLVAAVRGEVDLATAPQLHTVLTGAVTAYQPRQMIIDAAAMTFLDATGMSALISVYQHAKAHDVEIRMENVQASVMVPLRVVNLVEFLCASEQPHI